MTIKNKLKMYILIRESVEPGYAILAAAHASLAVFLKYQSEPEVTEWLTGPFYKVVCRVDDAQFEKAKQYDDYEIITESALEGIEVAVAFKPRGEWPKFFNFLRLYK